jgi:hypothetical protein
MDAATMNVLVELVLDLDRAGIRQLVPEGDRLRFGPRAALTVDLAERLKAHKAGLLTVLRPAGALGDGDLAALANPAAIPNNSSAAGPARAGWDDNVIDWPDPCPGCGGLIFWWNALGDRRCLRCDSPNATIRLLEKTERIRRRSGIPSPAGAAKMLAELESLTDTCNSAN